MKEKFVGQILLASIFAAYYPIANADMTEPVLTDTSKMISGFPGMKTNTTMGASGIGEVNRFYCGAMHEGYNDGVDAQITVQDAGVTFGFTAYFVSIGDKKSFVAVGLFQNASGFHYYTDGLTHDGRFYQWTFGTAEFEKPYHFALTKEGPVCFKIWVGYTPRAYMFLDVFDKWITAVVGETIDVEQNLRGTFENVRRLEGDWRLWDYTLPVSCVGVDMWYYPIIYERYHHFTIVNGKSHSGGAYPAFRI